MSVIVWYLSTLFYIFIYKTKYSSVQMLSFHMYIEVRYIYIYEKSCNSSLKLSEGSERQNFRLWLAEEVVPKIQISI